MVAAASSFYVGALIVVFFLHSFAATTARPAGFLYSRNRARCTPKYWNSRAEAWPKMVPQTSTVSNVFGSRAFERYRGDLTMLESTTAGNDEDDQNVFARLLQQGSAALLNSYSRKGFSYTAWEVKTLFIQALVSKEAAARQATLFAIANDNCY